MFTGIVQGMAGVVGITPHGETTTILVDLGEATAGLELGASVALNGNCVTVVAVQGSIVHFDLIRETLEISNLGDLSVGDRLNFERSFRVGDEVGGHILSGHVASTVEVADRLDDGGHQVLTFAVPKRWMPCLMPKGFVALNGASLTIVDVDRDACSFTVSLIPETLARTTFSDLGVGDRVNLEVDSTTQAVVETVEQLLNDDALLAHLSEVVANRIAPSASESPG